MIGAVFGGAGLKAIEQLFGRKKLKDDTAAQLRDELREDNARYKADLTKAFEDLEVWRAKYWTVFADFTNARLDLKRFESEIANYIGQLAEAKAEIERLQQVIASKG